MAFNVSPISLREAKVFLDGKEVYDQVKCTITITPDVWEGRQVGEKTPSSRWLGYKIAISITRRRTTPWQKDAIKKHLADGTTPEFTIQGVQSDKNSDYCKQFGTDTVTVVGCVPTGDLKLFESDSEGKVLEDTMKLNGKNLV